MAKRSNALAHVPKKHRRNANVPDASCSLNNPRHTGSRSGKPDLVEGDPRRDTAGYRVHVEPKCVDRVQVENEKCACVLLLFLLFELRALKFHNSAEG